ncbi:hypothetical protein [Bradyrhizobium sp. CCBAU 11357]|uniref:hypothetical protein n=1 Tax=Bradyrhizobium sp. CCBAU 11357 TaxID=1630808 RepID=UPI002302E155|nr:hypothetical protein [Bradyrhizobium sp. CCBAU 11357]MDA9498587.1 hypothetical protein [Bradyrhizobium sp. CCBAU 11357]
MSWDSGETIGSTEGYGVSSVASRKMAAGLPALSAMNGFARQSMLSPLMDRFMDRSHRLKRLLPQHFGDRQWCRMAIAAGSTVPQQKHTEIRFEGAVASCYLLFSMGPKGA